VPGLASELRGDGRFEDIEDDPTQVEDLGKLLGTQFALGRGKLLDRIHDNLFSRESGEGGPLDGVILTRAPLGELEADDRANVDALESGLVSGVADSGVTAVGVERSDVSQSAIEFFAPFDVATVDDVDLVSGKVALVFALLGAK